MNAAAIANAQNAKTQKHLNMYNILNNIKVTAQKTSFPYDGLIPQKIKFGKVAVINAINPKDPKLKTVGGYEGGDEDSEHLQPIEFYS